MIRNLSERKRKRDRDREAERQKERVGGAGEMRSYGEEQIYIIV